MAESNYNPDFLIKLANAAEEKKADLLANMENYAELNSSDEEVLEDVQDALSCIDRLLGIEAAEDNQQQDINQDDINQDQDESLSDASANVSGRMSSETSGVATNEAASEMSVNVWSPTSEASGTP